MLVWWIGRDGLRRGAGLWRLVCAFDALIDRVVVVLCYAVLPFSVSSGEALGTAGYTFVIVRNEWRGISLGWSSLSIATSIRAGDDGNI
jgi:hypothetical protein